MLEGLLGGLFGPMSDEKRNALLQAAATMMMSRGNTAQGIGSGLLSGATAYNQNKALSAKLAEEKQQQEMRQYMMEQQKQQMADRTGMRNAFSSAFGPNPNQVQNDDNGSPIPQAPGGGGMPEFLRNAGPYMDPMQAVSMMQKQQPKYHVVGGALVPEPQDGGQATPVYQAPEKPEGPKLGQMRELKSGRRVVTQEYDGKAWKTISTSEMDKPDGPPTPDKPPQGYRFNPDGSLAFIKGGPADPAGGKPTDTERVAAGYAQRMLEAEKIMGPKEATAGKPGLRESALAAMPGPGETLANALPEFMGGRSADRQSYRQAQEDWVRAKLRKESGAVIADQEMAREIRTYFPQVGDTPQVVAQKAKSRQVAIDAMKTGAGPVMQPDVNDLIRKYLGR